MIREAVVLVGGFGTRLRPVVSDVPKALALVGGRPFLCWLLDSLARQSVTRVLLATGYMGNVLRGAVGTQHADMTVLYSCEATPLGTGGAMWAALRLCEEDRVLVVNGDTWLGAPIASLAAEAPDADLVLAVRAVADRSRFGSLIVDGNRVLGLAEKGPGGPGLINAGVYVARRDLPSRLPMPDSFSLEREVLAAPGGLDLRAHLTDASFLDIGTPDDYLAAQTLIPAWAFAG
ncbi:sugar phosphate nucleotidyltransferase [Bradyrhizobium barranii subsp. apii]|uniref:Sugar phosphate nucleotidyltransferase n=1 Tax=Bradyrhizobium barranii subsp. apii TaxID=2819348 RepID=A0A8T5VQ08_9BRAD|nr:sugar phosphate nucleotidyltransferase [Bradyrhizobium barranii]UPT88641.1 sugar phosphate nucleotidyltransferase [Bradyrhizobium barranii subsp. apii]